MSFQSRNLDTHPRGATGPVTAAGKAIASQNARKHGLTAPPDKTLVATWFNVILNNQGDAFEAPNGDDPRRAAALRLAIAEAHYHRALHKIDTHESEPGSTQQAAQALRKEISDIFAGMPKTLSDGPHDPYELAYVTFAVEQLEILYHQTVRERALYQRYLNEARAQRKKALRAWCLFNRDETLNSRNELNLHQ